MPVSSSPAEQNWSSGGLKVALRSAPREVTIRIEGELEFATATVASAAFDRAIAEGCDRIVADLRPLRFLDSKGIQAIVDLRDRCSAAGIALDVLLDDGPVHRTLKVSGVLDLLAPAAIAA